MAEKFIYRENNNPLNLVILSNFYFENLFTSHISYDSSQTFFF